MDRSIKIGDTVCTLYAADSTGILLMPPKYPLKKQADGLFKLYVTTLSPNICGVLTIFASRAKTAFGRKCDNAVTRGGVSDLNIDREAIKLHIPIFHLKKTYPEAVHGNMLKAMRH